MKKKLAKKLTLTRETVLLFHGPGEAGDEALPAARGGFGGTTFSKTRVLEDCCVGTAA